MSDDAGRKLSPTALPLPEAARVLSASGTNSVTVEMLQGDIDAGAPTNADGTLNLIAYAGAQRAPAPPTRTRAGMRIGDARHVDLFRYLAWLVELRHTPRPESWKPPFGRFHMVASGAV